MIAMTLEAFLAMLRADTRAAERAAQHRREAWPAAGAGPDPLSLSRFDMALARLVPPRAVRVSQLTIDMPVVIENAPPSDGTGSHRLALRLGARGWRRGRIRLLVELSGQDLSDARVDVGRRPIFAGTLSDAAR